MKETAPKKVEKVYGKVTGFAATTTTDSLGTTFSKNALEKMLDYYEKNPFVYYNHDKSQPPVAKVISQRIVKAKDFYALEQEQEVYDAQIWEKIKTGELRGMSVGGVIPDD